MPYFAPDAPIPITSCAPRLAEMNASPQIHAGSDRPAWKKSLLVFIKRFSAKPMPSTKTKYNSMISQSTNVRFNGFRRHLPQATSKPRRIGGSVGLQPHGYRPAGERPSGLAHPRFSAKKTTLQPQTQNTPAKSQCTQFQNRSPHFNKAGSLSDRFGCPRSRPVAFIRADLGSFW